MTRARSWAFSRHRTTALHHGFLWYKNKMTDLGVGDGTASDAYSINSHGQVVGGIVMADNVTDHAFEWENGADLDNLPTYPRRLRQLFQHDQRCRRERGLLVPRAKKFSPSRYVARRKGDRPQHAHPR